MNIFNTELLKSLRAKEAFVPNDPAAMGTAPPGGAMPPGGDPMAALGGGMPPGAPPADPAAMGGAPPMDPAAAAGGGSAPPTREEIQAMIQQAVQAGGGAAGPGGKKKLDINTEIYHLKHLMVQLVGMLGGTVDPKVLMGDPAENPYSNPQEAASDPASAGAAPGALDSAIKPIQPIQPASPQAAGGAEKKGGFGSRGEGINQSQVTQMRDRASALLFRIKNAGKSA